MKLWKVVALVALVAVPLILLSKKKEEGPLPVAGDPEDIFGQELTEG